MNRLLIILFAVLTACMSQDMPNNMNGVIEDNNSYSKKTYKDSDREEKDNIKKIVPSNNRNGHVHYASGRKANNHADYYKLLIIKDDDRYLTYYAYDCQLLDENTMKVWIRWNDLLHELCHILAGFFVYIDANTVLRYIPDDYDGLKNKGIIYDIKIYKTKTSWITINRKYVKHLTAEEVKQLLKEPDNKVFQLDYD